MGRLKAYAKGSESLLRDEGSLRRSGGFGAGLMVAATLSSATEKESGCDSATCRARPGTNAVSHMSRSGLASVTSSEVRQAWDRAMRAAGIAPEKTCRLKEGLTNPKVITIRHAASAIVCA